MAENRIEVLLYLLLLLLGSGWCHQANRAFRGAAIGAARGAARGAAAYWATGKAGAATIPAGTPCDEMTVWYEVEKAGPATATGAA